MKHQLDSKVVSGPMNTPIDKLKGLTTTMHLIERSFFLPAVIVLQSVGQEELEEDICRNPR